MRCGPRPQGRRLPFLLVTMLRKLGTFAPFLAADFFFYEEQHDQIRIDSNIVCVSQSGGVRRRGAVAGWK
jgi:hypothetical protein